MPSICVPTCLFLDDVQAPAQYVQLVMHAYQEMQIDAEKVISI